MGELPLERVEVGHLAVQGANERLDLAVRISDQPVLDRVLILDDLRREAVERRPERVVAGLGDGDLTNEACAQRYPPQHRTPPNYPGHVTPRTAGACPCGESIPPAALVLTGRTGPSCAER